MRKSYRKFRYSSKDFTIHQVIAEIIKLKPQLSGKIRAGYQHGEEYILLRSNGIHTFKLPLGKTKWKDFKYVTQHLSEQISEKFKPEVKSFLKGDEMSWEKARSLRRAVTKYKELNKNQTELSRAVLDQFYKG